MPEKLPSPFRSSTLSASVVTFGATPAIPTPFRGAATALRHHVPCPLWSWTSGSEGTNERLRARSRFGAMSGWEVSAPVSRTATTTSRRPRCRAYEPDAVAPIRALSHCWLESGSPLPGGAAVGRGALPPASSLGISCRTASEPTPATCELPARAAAKSPRADEARRAPSCGSVAVTAPPASATSFEAFAGRPLWPVKTTRYCFCPPPSVRALPGAASVRASTAAPSAASGRFMILSRLDSSPPCIGPSGLRTHTSSGRPRTRKGGREAALPATGCFGGLRREVAVDVLVDPAVMRAEIAAPEADRPLLRLDWVEGTALMDVGRRRG